MTSKSQKKFLLQDTAIILLSVFTSIILAKTGILAKILTLTKGLEIIGSFTAGMFFTSIFTTSLAIVALGEIARVNGILSTAILGGVGAVIGDLIIFRFIRDRFSEHLLELAQHKKIWKKFRTLLKLRYFRWFTFFASGLIIASPLPDELGISLLGFSKMRMRWFIPLSFLFNSAGILIIGIIAKTI